MGAVTYSLCALTCVVVFALLLRGWRATRHPLLFWSALCFAALCCNNVLLVLDKLVLPQVNLETPRLLFALAGPLLLLFGLIWEDE